MKLLLELKTSCHIPYGRGLSGFVSGWPRHPVFRCSVPSGKFRSLEVQREGRFAGSCWSSATAELSAELGLGPPRPVCLPSGLLLFVRLTVPHAQISHHTRSHWPFFPALLHLVGASGDANQPACSKCANPAKQAGRPGPGDVNLAQRCMAPFWPGLELCSSVGRGGSVCRSLEWHGTCAPGSGCGPCVGEAAAPGPKLL